MNAWQLNSNEMYVLQGDDLVRDLMRQLRVPNLFAGAAEFDELHAFAAFDNHPTHWIILHLWKGLPAYSPNHQISQLVRDPDPNGLLFEAVPKSTANRARMEIRLVKETQAMGANQAFVFQQLPSLSDRA
ncbi:hypothetical protein [Oleiharenicola lentus]|uniref:hypothetical protein n=1 Tax=Oleiharenicola lentus TaxID=2508720 RepID=UPI003F666E85